jgi:decaprenyl-phosphate phosphoribosyltransferase
MAQIEPTSTEHAGSLRTPATSWLPVDGARSRDGSDAGEPSGFTRTAVAVVRACRPHQWVKNVLVLAAPGAAGVLLDAEVPGHVALAFIAFCLLASCTYLLNDVHDRVEDAGNPAKRTRPVASGEVSPHLAVATAVVLALAGLAVAAACRPELAGVGAAYLALTAAYTRWLREVAVADIVAVAACFVVRAIAGGVATAVPVSRWFVIVTCFGALFLVAGKRYAELSAASTTPSQLDGAASTLRPALRAYSVGYLQFVMMVAGAVAIGAYCLWAFQHRAEGVAAWYDITILPFVMWVFRYALLVDQGSGHAPEELVLGDRFLLSMSLAWAALFAGAVYVGG